jgi:DNA end-binding protein Ku
MAAIWKGVIRFEDIAVPIKLFAAIEDRSVHFRLLHAEDHVPVEQRMIDPGTEEPVPTEETRKAYELDDGRLVILDPDDLESLEPESSRDVEILRFVEPEAITRTWFRRPYFVAPDGSPAIFAAFTRALEQSGRIAIARWVMRKKDYIGAFTVEDGRLSLVTLRWSDEVIEAAELPRPAGRAPTSKELQLARQLVGTLEEPLDMSRFDDAYRARVLELVEAKAAGEEIELPEPTRRPAAPASLEAALRASLGAGGKKTAASKKKKKKTGKTARAGRGGKKVA